MALLLHFKLLENSYGLFIITLITTTQSRNYMALSIVIFLVSFEFIFICVDQDFHKNVFYLYFW